MKWSDVRHNNPRIQTQQVVWKIKKALTPVVSILYFFIVRSLLITFIAIATLVSLPKAQADDYTGYYKVAIVITGEETYEGEFYTYQDGETGRFRVYLNANNKLRLRGYIDTAFDSRLLVRGRVKKSTGEIILTSVGGEPVETAFTVFKILKRNGTVVGLKGFGETSGEDEFGTYNDVSEIVGYKTRDISAP